MKRLKLNPYSHFAADVNVESASEAVDERASAMAIAALVATPRTHGIQMSRPSPSSPNSALNGGSNSPAPRNPLVLPLGANLS